MSTVLITGAATGIGNLTAKALARAGHRVYASMRNPEGRNPEGRNAAHARELRDLAAAEQLDVRVTELDVTSQETPPSPRPAPTLSAAWASARSWNCAALKRRRPRPPMIKLRAI